MELKLNIYTDESLREVSHTVTADKLKIPYKVSMYIIQSFDGLDINNQDDIIKYLSQNIDKLDKIIKATFGLTDSELECIETTELIDTALELYRWGIDKISSIKGGSKNV